MSDLEPSGNIPVPHSNASRTSSRDILFSSALQNTLEALIIINHRGNILDWDSHAETIFGWARGEMIGADIASIFDAESIAALHREMRRLAILPISLLPEISDRHFAFYGRHRTGMYFAVECLVHILPLHTSPPTLPSAPAAPSLLTFSFNTPFAEIGIAEQNDYCLFIRDIEKFKNVYVELRKRERRYRILSYFSSSVFGNDSVTAVLWDIAKNCIAELDFEDAVVYWLDKEHNILVQRAAYGMGKEINLTVRNPIEIPIGKGIVGAAAASASTVKVDDTTLDPRYIVDDAPRLSEIAVPIVHKGTVLGVIDSEHSSRHFFTEEDVLIVEQMAAIAATKIVRIQAEERVHEMNEQLEHLVEERTQELSAANEEIRRQMEILAHQTQEIEFTNLTLQEKNEELVSLNAELEEASRFKTQVLSIVAHDLKNPLGLILHYADFVVQELQAEHFSKQAGERSEAKSASGALSFVRRIVDTAEHMFALVTRLLDAAAIDMGRVELSCQSIKLAPLLTALADNFELRAGQKKQKIRTEFASSSLIYGDEERLYQVFENILSNAVKYSPQSATIDIRLYDTEQIYDTESNAELRVARSSQNTPTDSSLSNNQGYVCVEILDEGPGFSDDDKTKLFRFFQPLSARPTGGETSNGVGLAIAKKIVDLHKGMMYVESRLGKGLSKGSRVIVALPIMPTIF